MKLLSPVGHAALRHPFKLPAHAALLNLANSLFLRILKVTLVTKHHQVSRLAHLTLETAESALDRFAIAHIDLDES